MQGNNLRALISQATESTPGISIATIGLSLVMFTYESQRMSSFQSVEQGSFSSSIVSAIALGLFVLFIFIYRARPSFRLHRHTITGLLLAVIYAVCALLLSGQGFGPTSETVQFIAKTIARLSRSLFLLCWAELLIPLGARRVAIIFSFSLFALGMINALSAFIRIEAAHIFIAAFPLISMTCLYWFKAHSSSLDMYSSKKQPDAFSMFHLDRSLMPSGYTAKTKVSLWLIFLLPLTCYSFVFGHIHFAWVPAQDGSFVSTSIQMAAATGTMLGGAILLFLITYFWGRKKLELYNLFILPILILALYISLLTGGQYSFLYVVPLNIAQKLAFFFIWISPFLIPSNKSPLLIWCVAFSLYQLGQILSISVASVPDTLLYSIWVIAFVILLIIGIATGVLLDRGSRLLHNAPGTGDSVPSQIMASVTSGTAASLYEESDLPPSLNGDARRCHAIAREYQLTRREEEILQLLAEGLAAQAIAETLVVSTSTAKSHMRNIYAKLGIHTQGELLILVHRK